MESDRQSIRSISNEKDDVVVLGDGPTCTGFRLAGVRRVFSAQGVEAEKKFEELLKDESIGIIIINEKIVASFDWRLKRRIERIAKPVVITIPDKNGPLEDKGDSLREMIKKALGFEVMK